MYKTLGGRVTCTQCNATSKRTKERCRAPAVKGKTKCRFHGGAQGSGRPITHGRETREKRSQHSVMMSELRVLEEIGFTCGLYPVGTPRMSGRKPLGYPASAGSWDELRRLHSEERREAIIDILRSNITSSDSKSEST
jgi:hypothetical protein